MNTIQETAPAKINLTLSVSGRRPDGYHTVDTLMHSTTLADTVEITLAPSISLTVDGDAPARPENLMWRAAALFFQRTRRGGAAMHLVKRIPSEAGLGGGSADAAAVLRGLNVLTGMHLPVSALCRMGAELGADIPFCVAGGCARCGGTGTDLSPLPAWPGIPLLIVRPEIAVSTRLAYQEIDRHRLPRRRTADKAVRAIGKRNLPALIAALSNDFEEALFPVAPRLSETARELRATGYPALMSGSGSAFFLILPKKVRPAVAEALRAAHPDWFIAEAETR